jgi:hypothetical protein
LKIDTLIRIKSSIIADSPKTLRIAADHAESLQRVDDGSPTHREAMSYFSPSAVDSSRYRAGGILEASRQVDLLERKALLGSALRQNFFNFASADSSHGTFKSDSRGKISKQVTKREKRGLLNSGKNKNTLNLYE